MLHNLVSLLNAELLFNNLTADKCGRLIASGADRSGWFSRTGQVPEKQNEVPSAHTHRNEEVRFLTELRLSLSIAATYDPTITVEEIRLQELN